MASVGNKKQIKKQFTGYMLNRTLQMFGYEKLPETIPQIELEKLLQENGFAIIAKANGELYAFNGTLGGEYDAYGRPTTAIVSNPYLKFNETLTIGKDCVVIYNDYMKLGIKALIDSTSDIIAESKISLIIGLINKRAQTMISASDDSTIESAKAYVKKLVDGDIDVVSDSKIFESLKAQDVSGKQTGTLKDIYETEQYQLATLYNNLGLNSNFNMKRERMITSEIEANNDVLYPLVESFLESRLIGITELNELFEESVEVDFRSVWKVKQQIQAEEIEMTDDQTEEELKELDGTSEQTGNAETETQVQSETETDSESIDQEESAEDATALETESDVSRETDAEIIDAQNEEIEELQAKLEEDEETTE